MKFEIDEECQQTIGIGFSTEIVYSTKHLKLDDTDLPFTRLYTREIYFS